MKASIRTFGQFLNPFRPGDRRTADYYWRRDRTRRRLSHLRRSAPDHRPLGPRTAVSAALASGVDRPSRPINVGRFAEPRANPQ